MAKKETKVEAEEIEVETAPAPLSNREIRWKKYVENYKVSNPVKAAQKEARGEFDTIPASFR